MDYKGISYQERNLIPGLHLLTTRKLAEKSYVPILQHEGRYMQNSRYILDYLDDSFPQRQLTPRQPDEMAASVEWERLADVDIGRSVRCFCYHHLLQVPEVVVPMFTKNTSWWTPLFFKVGFGRLEPVMRQTMHIDADTAHQSMRDIELALDTINDHLQGDTYLIGDRFTRADLCIAAMLAPLFMPQGYGLDWPASEQIPDALNAFRERNADKLKFAERIYALHR